MNKNIWFCGIFQTNGIRHYAKSSQSALLLLDKQTDSNEGYTFYVYRNFWFIIISQSLTHNLLNTVMYHISINISFILYHKLFISRESIDDLKKKISCKFLMNLTRNLTKRRNLSRISSPIPLWISSRKDIVN